MKQQRAVLFDMDGVIVDAMKYHVDAWQRSFRRHVKINVPSEKVYQAEGVKGEEFIEQILQDYNVTASTEIRRAINDDKKNIFNEIFNVEPIDGIKKVIRLLDGYSYALAVVSGAPRDAVDHVLQELHMSSTFQTVVSGDDIDNGKPSPDPFVKAARNLNAPSQLCMVVENAPLGISAAKKAGMKCIALETSLDHNHLKEADLLFKNHDQVQQFFMKEHALSNGDGEWKIN